MYNPKELEKKWQAYWDKNKTFKTENDFSKTKYYTLDMFPFPSGAGLHVGHPEGYTANDIIARYKHAKGYNVLHPMGWDAFGLPAENYAIKTGIHPKIVTKQNIDNFRRQIKSLGISYDWDREVDTTDPKYYKWTQWIFLKMFEHGLAYEQDLPINYCPSCKTGLANEEVLNDFTCERCGEKVEKKKIRQWVLAITKYADRLLKDVDKLDWPESIKEMQRNWIGKSEGCEFEMKKAQKKGDSPLHNVGGHNVLARISLSSIILESILKVKKKNKKIKLSNFNKLIKGRNNISEISINGKYLFNHFIKKSKKEFLGRVNLFSTIVKYIENINFEQNTGYIIINNYIVRLILGNDENGLFLKTYYISDKLTKEYKEYLKEQNTSIPSIRVYTTRIDTVFGMTYAVVAPDHKDVEKFITKEQRQACEKYIKEASQKSDQDRTADDKEKTGVFTGSYVINPFNGKDVPLWIADYVLGNYGTGAVMAVPAHDTRDFEFAKKYDLEIIQVIEAKNKKEVELPFTEYGILVNSLEFNGLDSKTAQKKLIEFATKKGFGEKKINYKLRDWLFSRQRYWGEPIPLIHLEIPQVKQLPHITDISEATDENKAYILKRAPKEGGNATGAICPSSGMVRELIIGGKVFSKIYDGIYGKIVCDYKLPLELPEMEDFAPAGDGQSPLAKVDDFVNVKLAENLTGKRETNTMPQWGGSCWYYLRYIDPHNPDKLVDPEVEKYWGQVDSYVGGAEHAVLHLLYARFWHKFLFDIGVVSHDEPFYRLRNQGLIQSYIYVTEKGKSIHMDLVEEKDGEYFHKDLGAPGGGTGEKLEKKIGKMSKSLGNIINPDDIIEEYGADSLRLYEMYMADFKDSAPWDTKNIIGVRRFLEKVERLFTSLEAKIAKNDNEAMKILNKTIKKVGDDIENYKFNTAIAQMMILANYGRPSDEKLFLEWKEKFVVILSAFAPFLSEELWEQMGNKKSIFLAKWPEYDEKLVVDNTIKIAVQVLGKVRGTIEISKDEDKTSVLEKAKNNENIAKWLEGKNIVKEIYVPGKIVNLVIK